MKLGDLIRSLEKLAERHGDSDVVHGDEWEWPGCVAPVEAVEWDEDARTVVIR